MAELLLRTASRGDVGFLRAMLFEAAYWRPDDPRPPMADALDSPELRVYLRGWGRDGDRGLIAVASTASQEEGLAETEDDLLGAAWYRRFFEEEHGYGFVDPDTPEVTIAVTAAHRGMGVGRALLAALVVQARLDGVPALSLSVEDDNPARRLYERSGFETVARVGNARTMLARLGSPGG